MDARGGPAGEHPEEPRLVALSVSVAIDPILRSGARGRVLRVHRTAVDLTVDGHPIVLLEPSLGDEPHGMRVVGLGLIARQVSSGDGVFVGDDVLRVGSRLAIRVTAPRWQPRLDPIGSVDARRLDVLGALLRRDRASLLDVAVDARLAVLRACLDGGSHASAIDAGRRLIGLGPGLTPSGDDILVALTAAMRALGDPRSGLLAAAWAGSAEGRTSDLAATFHRHAARGEYGARLHELLHALLAGPPSAARDAIDRTRRWGATSGRDTLVGVALALDSRPLARGLAA